MSTRRKPALNGSEIPRPLAGTVRRSDQIRIMARRVGPRQMLVVALSVLVSITVAQALSRARQQSERLGERLPVLVASTDLAAGTQLDESNIRISYWPAGLVPPGALSDLGEVRVLLRPVGAGEPLTQTATVDSGGLGADERALLIPVYLPLDGFSVGDNIEVFAVLPIGNGQTVAAAASLIGSGRLLSITDESATVALRAPLVPAVLEALAMGSVDLVRSPG